MTLAERLGHAPDARLLIVNCDDIGSSHAGLVANAPRVLQSVAAKSVRFVGEMEEISRAQSEAGLPPELFAAFAVVYEQLSRTEAARRSPEQVDGDATLEDVLMLLEEREGA